MVRSGKALEIKELYKQLSITQLANLVNRDRKTVCKILRQEKMPQVTRRRRKSKLDPYIYGEQTGRYINQLHIPNNIVTLIKVGTPEVSILKCKSAQNKLKRKKEKVDGWYEP